MNFEGFFASVAETGIEVSVGTRTQNDRHLLDNEALFQLPLISLIILLMAKGRRKPFISEIGQLVGESIDASIPAFKGSSQHLGWSANLRIRTVSAVSFLEVANLIIVNNRKGKIDITDLGKKVIGKAISRDDNLAYNMARISCAYRNVCVSRQLELEIE